MPKGVPFRPLPTRCIEGKPTAKSVLFCDVFINLSLISLKTSYTVPHISMIFAGKRKPSISAARKIALALNMDLNSFLERLDEHAHLVKPYLNKTRKSA